MANIVIIPNHVPSYYGLIYFDISGLGHEWDKDEPILKLQSFPEWSGRRKCKKCGIIGLIIKRKSSNKTFTITNPLNIKTDPLCFRCEERIN